MELSSNDEIRIGKLDISDDLKDVEDKLKACERDIGAINIDCLTELSFEKKKQTLADYILLLNKIVEIVVCFLEKAQIFVPQPIQVILKLLTNIIKIYFHKDVASIVTKYFDKMISEELTRRCRATCQRISYCASYVKSMPDTEDIGERRLQLQLLASDFPVHDAITDVLEVGDRIQHMMEKKDLKKFKELVFLFQFYCTMSTFTEMYLLYRIAVMSKYGEDASPINAVLQKHRDYDNAVLKIAYRPTKMTVELYMKCELDKWPILNSFLARRKLFSESIGYNMIPPFQIRPLNNKTKCITYRKKIFRQHYSLVLTDSAEHSHYFFTFNPDSENEESDKSYCISAIFDTWEENVCAASDSLILSRSRKDKWRILKIYPESEAEKPAHIIWLADNYEKCLCLSRWNNVVLKTCTQPVEKCLWTFRMQPKTVLRFLLYCLVLVCVLVLSVLNL